MRILLILIITGMTVFSYAQISGQQQKAFNAYVDYANQSAKEVTLVIDNLKQYHDDLAQERSWSTQHFTCPVQPDDYFFNTAVELKSAMAGMPEKELLEMRGVAKKIDSHCKMLDTYYKLQDYKLDNHAKGDSLLKTFPDLLVSYRQKRRALQQALSIAYSKATEGVTHPYKKAETLMAQQLRTERKVLDRLVLNFQDNVHTGWERDQLFQGIPVSIEGLNHLKAQSLQLKYPASSAWPLFLESLTFFIKEKRRAVDEYNWEAMKTDKHSNGVYLNLINYFNGTLVANYNNFIQFSQRDGYHGLKSFTYVPQFVFRTERKNVDILFANPPDTIAHKIPSFKRTAGIDNKTFSALSNYVDLINNMYQQVRYLQMVLTSFNSSASYYKNVIDYSKRAPMHFDYDEFYLPHSYLQNAIRTSKYLPDEVGLNLNKKAEYLFHLMLQMDAHTASIDVAVGARQYETDHLRSIYNHLEELSRCIVIWDEKKEKFYHEIVGFYDSFAPQPETSWSKSGKVLWNLLNADRESLFIAKTFYKGDTTVVFPIQKTDDLVREVIAHEYDNLAGIEKLGRYNGNCPYTPYEDLATTSRNFNDKIRNIRHLKRSGGKHPYETLVYLYNEAVENYNEFCDLAKVSYLLKSIHQPEIFEVIYPKQDSAQPITGKHIHERATDEVVKEKEKVIQILRDTIYIEKHDTVYLSGSEDLRSMKNIATNNLILLLDVSGSMNTAQKLPTLKKSVQDIVQMMREEDKLAIVVFSGKAKVLLKSVSFKDEEKILEAINSLASEGKTDADAGLQLAYKVADQNYIRGGNNRIILATDGEFPLKEKTTMLIRQFASQDIYLTVFDFGNSTSASLKLTELALNGKGNYEHITPQNIDLKLIHEVKAKRTK